MTRSRFVQRSERGEARRLLRRQRKPQLASPLPVVFKHHKQTFLHSLLHSKPPRLRSSNGQPAARPRQRKLLPMHVSRMRLMTITMRIWNSSPMRIKIRPWTRTSSHRPQAQPPAQLSVLPPIHLRLRDQRQSALAAHQPIHPPAVNRRWTAHVGTPLQVSSLRYVHVRLSPLRPPCFLRLPFCCDLAMIPTQWRSVLSQLTMLSFIHWFPRPFVTRSEGFSGRIEGSRGVGDWPFVSAWHCWVEDSTARS